ncbi:hypothetical protein AAG906_030759 [Vitis piasezkii]
MTKDRDVSSQIHDYYLLINDLVIEDIKLPKPFVVGYIVETLPESWKDYKNNMKHKRKQMSLEDVIINIRNEEQNRNRDNVEKAKELSSKANVVKEKPKPKKNRSRRQISRTKSNASNKVQNPTIKKRGNFFVCGKSGHHAAQCRHKKRIEKSNSKANMVETEVITTVISSECIYFLYHSKGRRGTMIGKWKFLLKLTSRKLLALIDVLHVLDIHWNLVSVSLLGKTRVRILFDFDKIVLTKNDAFLGKGLF